MNGRSPFRAGRRFRDRSSRAVAADDGDDALGDELRRRLGAPLRVARVILRRCPQLAPLMPPAALMSAIASSPALRIAVPGSHSAGEETGDDLDRPGRIVVGCCRMRQSTPRRRPPCSPPGIDVRSSADFPWYVPKAAFGLIAPRLRQPSPPSSRRSRECAGGRRPTPSRQDSIRRPRDCQAPATKLACGRGGISTRGGFQ
jgi:hypothetical protein